MNRVIVICSCSIFLENVLMAILMFLLMWGIVYQGYNATFPSFYPELFPTKSRVSAMAISQNLGTMITAFLPALFVTMAPPGAENIPVVIGTCTLLITILVAVIAFSARETFNVPLVELDQLKKD